MPKRQIIGVLLILVVVPFLSLIYMLTLNWQFNSIDEHFIRLEEELRIITEYKRDIISLEDQIEVLSIDLEVCKKVQQSLVEKMRESY